MVKTNCFKEFAKYVSLNVMGMIAYRVIYWPTHILYRRGLVIRAYSFEPRNPIYSFIHAAV